MAGKSLQRKHNRHDMCTMRRREYCRQRRVVALQDCINKLAFCVMQPGDFRGFSGGCGKEWQYKAHAGVDVRL